MIDELIEEIKRVEKQAEEDIRSSVQRAKEIESAANNRAAELDAENKKLMRRLRLEAIAQAEEKADKAYRDIMATAEAEANAIGGDKRRIDAAIKIIADGILK